MKEKFRFDKGIKIRNLTPGKYKVYTGSFSVDIKERKERKRKKGMRTRR